jgi:hypothetical protein
MLNISCCGGKDLVQKLLSQMDELGKEYSLIALIIICHSGAFQNIKWCDHTKYKKIVK